MEKSTFLFSRLFVIVLMCVISQAFSQDRIAVLREPMVILLDPADGSIVDPAFIDLSPLNQGTPKALIQVNDEIWITDQIEDRIDRFDLDGNYLSAITVGLDNIRGLGLVNNSEVWVTNAGSNNGAPGNAIVRFDLNGNNLGFYSTGADSTFDVIDTGGEVFVSYIGAGSRIERRDYNGNVLGNVVGTGVVTFVQQIEINSSNNSVYAAVFSSTGGNFAGLYEFNIANGAILNSWAEGSLRGVAQLTDGNILVSAGNGYGVKILNPTTGTTTTLWTDASQYFGRLNLTLCTTPPTPTGDSNQSFQEGATIEDIVVDPPGVTWFPTENDALNSTNPIAPGTLLVDGQTYWAVNIVNGCKSAPFPVTVSVCSIPPTPSGDSNQSFQEGAAIEDIVVDPPGVTWFPTENDALNSTNPIAPGTLLVDGETYWAVNIVDLCKSAPFPVTVSVCTIPATPTGENTQTLPEGSTLDDIVIDPADVTWFATENDALNNTNPLPNSTPVEDGTTYWAVSIDGICLSTPFPVTILFPLGLAEFAQYGISVYPNPVSETLAIQSANYSIESAAIFNIVGQQVYQRDLSNVHLEIDLSSYSEGVYILQIQVNGKVMTTKLIKE